MTEIVGVARRDEEARPDTEHCACSNHTVTGSCGVLWAVRPVRSRAPVSRSDQRKAATPDEQSPILLAYLRAFDRSDASKMCQLEATMPALQGISLKSPESRNLPANEKAVKDMLSEVYSTLR